MKWLTIPTAAAYLKKENELSMISESTLRTLVRSGFPCVLIGSRSLINVDTFYDDLITHTNRRKNKHIQHFDNQNSEVTTA